MTTLAPDSKRATPARLAGGAVLACQSDARLVELLRQGHDRAFDAIVDRYRVQLVRFCARILPNSRTEDAVQQALINAHAALLSTDDPPAQLKPWLYTVARNAALNMLRQNGWHYEQIPLDFDGVRRPEQVVEQRLELQKTVAAVNDLPDRQRDAIVMREFEGRSYEEIALALGTGDGAVRQLLNRARGTLRAAASALMPPPVVTRAASSLPPADGRRVAEVLGSFGAAGVAKVGATALVAGSLVVGTVDAPVPLVSGHGATHAKVTLAHAAAHRKAAAALTSPDASGRSFRGHGRGLGHHDRSAADSHGHARGHAPGSGHSRGHDGADHRSRSDQHSHSVSGSDDHRSGSGGSGSRSGDSHSGTSGSRDRLPTSGSGQVTTRSGSDGGSGTSGSGSTGSDSSGSGSSGTSGSGSSGSTTSGGGDGSSGSSGSTTSGSSDGGSSGSSGSSYSGSTSSGSGSDDPLP